MRKFETKGERTARIIRTIVRYLHDVSIRQLAADIGCNYMQLYYCSVGKTFELSDELVDAFKLSYPQFREEFLRYGTGKLLAKAEVDDDNDDDSEDNLEPDPVPSDPEVITPSPESPVLVNPVGVDEMTRLFARVLDLVDVLRTREEQIRDLKQDLLNIQQRLARLEAKQNEPS